MFVARRRMLLAWPAFVQAQLRPACLPKTSSIFRSTLSWRLSMSRIRRRLRADKYDEGDGGRLGRAGKTEASTSSHDHQTKRLVVASQLQPSTPSSLFALPARLHIEDIGAGAGGVLLCGLLTSHFWAHAPLRLLSQPGALLHCSPIHA